MMLTYPGGNLKTITISPTPGDETTNESPGSRKRWLWQFGRLELVCNGTVINRNINMVITDGSNIILTLFSSDNVAASQVGDLDVGPFTAPAVNGLYGRAGSSVPSVLSIQDLILQGDDQIRFTIANGQAGDSYSGFLRVLEFGL